MDKTDADYGANQGILPALSLFTSTGTLVCCALPALFVTIGAGAALAGLVESVPWLIELSRYKVETFGISGTIILFTGVMLWRGRNAACPIDPKKAAACGRMRKVSVWIYGASALLWFVGFFFAFVAVRIFY